MNGVDLLRAVPNSPTDVFLVVAGGLLAGAGIALVSGKNGEQKAAGVLMFLAGLVLCVAALSS
jgi:hypothetical protein